MAKANEIRVKVTGYCANDKPLIIGQFSTQTTYSQLLEALKTTNSDVVYAKITVQTL